MIPGSIPNSGATGCRWTGLLNAFGCFKAIAGLRCLDVLRLSSLVLPGRCMLIRWPAGRGRRAQSICPPARARLTRHEWLAGTGDGAGRAGARQLDHQQASAPEEAERAEEGAAVGDAGAEQVAGCGPVRAARAARAARGTVGQPDTGVHGREMRAAARRGYWLPPWVQEAADYTAVGP